LYFLKTIEYPSKKEMRQQNTKVILVIAIDFEKSYFFVNIKKVA
jgi:hypothetical protein